MRIYKIIFSDALYRAELRVALIGAKDSLEAYEKFEKRCKYDEFYIRDIIFVEETNE